MQLQLQRVQNWVSRRVTSTRESDTITPVLYHLHWFPIQNIIAYKMTVLTYRALHGLAPAYPQELVVPYRQSRSLLSTNGNTLVMPVSRLKTVVNRKVAYAAPRTWNSPPPHSVSGVLSILWYLRRDSRHTFSEMPMITAWMCFSVWMIFFFTVFWSNQTLLMAGLVWCAGQRMHGRY